MKVGDRVRVVKTPRRLKEGELKTRTLFLKCVGQVFPVKGLHRGLLELEVGYVLGEPPYMHSIWIESEMVEPFLTSKKRKSSSTKTGVSKHKKLEPRSGGKL